MVRIALNGWRALIPGTICYRIKVLVPELSRMAPGAIKTSQVWSLITHQKWLVRPCCWQSSRFAHRILRSYYRVELEASSQSTSFQSARSFHVGGWVRKGSNSLAELFFVCVVRYNTNLPGKTGLVVKNWHNRYWGNKFLIRPEVIALQPCWRRECHYCQRCRHWWVPHAVRKGFTLVSMWTTLITPHRFK